MGYSTDFSGVLAFTSKVDVEQLRFLKTMLGEDRRDHADWNVPRDATWYHLDLDVTDDFNGLAWNGAEKTYGMVEIVNFVLDRMRARWPDFGLAGELFAKGEDGDDRWRLCIANGRAVKVKADLAGTKVQCPSCDHRFRVNADGSVAE